MVFKEINIIICILYIKSDKEILILEEWMGKEMIEYLDLVILFEGNLCKCS